MVTWTNSSARTLVRAGDPSVVIAERARELVLDAIDHGWKGPPFDPFDLADLMGVRVEPKEEVADARVVSRDGNLLIEFNPNKPRQRVRFSIAHELGHTLFEDCAQVARNRGENHAPGSDAWQLELLCNLAASEFLMPIGEAIDPKARPTVEYLLDLQSRFDVSAEAVAIRLASVSERPCTIVVAARQDEETGAEGYRVDYAVPTRSSTIRLARGTIVKSRVFGECTAVGFTAKGSEELLPSSSSYAECLGIPPYPGSPYPRVLGIVTTDSQADRGSQRLSAVYLRGDALLPRGAGPKFIVQLVNDRSRTWGGGFAASVRKRYPEGQEEFHEWASSHRNLKLGKIHLSTARSGVSVASLVAQHGVGPSESPRIRYSALARCLQSLAAAAIQTNSTVHMPRIGTGASGGSWSVVFELVDEILVRRGVEVFIYDPPGRHSVARRVLGGTVRPLDEAMPGQEDSSG